MIIFGDDRHADVTVPAKAWIDSTRPAWKTGSVVDGLGKNRGVIV